MEPEAKKNSISQPLEGWEDMNPNDPSTWRAQVQFPSGDSISMHVDEAAKLMAIGQCWRSVPNPVKENKDA